MSNGNSNSNHYDGQNDQDEEDAIEDLNTQPLLNNSEPTGELDIYDIDDLFEKSGGFGKMQWLIVIFTILSYQGINFYIYNLAFLELMPKLLWKDASTGNFKTCGDSSDICHKGKTIDSSLWKVDFSDEMSFHNWMTELHLFWEDGFLIGLLGSMYFVGFAVNGLFLKQSDKFGRKKIIIIGCFLQILWCFAFYFARNLYAYYAIFLISGITVAKNIWVYIYSTESVPEKYQLLVGAVWLSNDVIVAVLPTAIYFYSGGKNWQTIFIPTLVLPFISFGLSFFLPESPRYLMAKKEFKALKDTFETYAKVNGVEMSKRL
jgi:MFS family permease